MVDIDEIYASGNNLKAKDLKGRTIKLKIAGYLVREFSEKNGSKKSKVVLSFPNTPKTFVCNTTNAKMIGAVLGKNPDNWIGKEIELFPDQTMLGDELVDCIKARAVPLMAPDPIPAAAFNDDIPF